MQRRGPAKLFDGSRRRRAGFSGKDGAAYDEAEVERSEGVERFGVERVSGRLHLAARAAHDVAGARIGSTKGVLE